MEGSMNLATKHLIALSIIVSAFGWTGKPAAAQDWPTKPITLVIPFGPGSGTDLVARIISTPLSELLGQPVIVQNLGGAGGLLGVSRAAKAAPDGYTVVIGGVDTFAQSPSLRKEPPYDPRKDFTPSGLALVQPLILIARNSLGPKNMKEFAAYVQANHGKMQFGSSGVGSAPHLVCSELTKVMGANITHLSYRGSAEAMKDVLSGHIDFYCALAATAMPQLTADAITPIAVLTRERSIILPNLPTAKEQGFDVGDFYYWMGLFFPKDTPDAIVTKFNAALGQILDRPEIQARMRDFATTVVPPERRTPQYMRKFLNDEIETWAKAIKESGITPQ
jgi:tripartite-type tricarboxylate transporter receptor subunit TctC